MNSFLKAHFFQVQIYFNLISKYQTNTNWLNLIAANLFALIAAKYNCC